MEPVSRFQIVSCKLP